MSSLLLLALLALALAWGSHAAGPSVQSATYQVKRAEVMGLEWEHLLFDVTFDQDIYFQDNWACGCVNDTASLTSRTNPFVVAEPAGVNVTLMEKGRWYEARHAFTAQTAWKLNLPRASSSAPIVIWEVQMIAGEVNLHIANQFFPTPGKKQWTKLSWYHGQRWWLCPTHPEWAWGDFYGVVSGYAPESHELWYRIRWTTLEAPICPYSPPPLPGPPSGTEGGKNWTALRDTQPWTGPLPFLEYNFFRYYVTAPCTDFAVSARQHGKAWEEFGDVDLFVSIEDSNKFPTLETHNSSQRTWASQIDNDDNIILRGVCSPTGATPWTIYVGAYNWAGAVITGVITATTTANFNVHPLTEIEAYSIPRTLANGGALVECGDEERYACEFPSNDGCDVTPNVFNCCTPFYPIPPTRNTTLNNHLWPENKGYGAYTNFLRLLPWEAYTPPSTYDTKRLQFAVLRSVRSGTELLQRFQFKDPSTCRLRWKNVYTNQQGQIVNATVTVFRPLQLACDHQRLTHVRNEALSLSSRMQFATSYSELRLLHLKLAFLTQSDDWVACKERLAEFYETITSVRTYPDQSSCPEGSWGYRTNDYLTNPCCNVQPQFDQCCAPRDFTDAITLPASYDPLAIEQSCLVSECTRRSIDGFVSTQAANNDPTTGCLATWKSRADESAVAELLRFSKHCRVEIMGYGSLLGRPCDTDADCLPGRLCQPSSKTCNHNDDDVIACLAANITEEVAFALFERYGVAELVTQARLRELFAEHFMGQFCTGPNALDYRDGYFFGQELPDCKDECVNSTAGIDLAPRCFDAGDEEFCPMPYECASENTLVGRCLRRWIPTDNSARASKCEEEKVCNWLDCEALNLTASQCQAACLNSTAGVCLTCSEGACRALALTQTQCGQSVCSLNEALTNPAQCAQLGSCSAECPTRTTKNSCEADGVCTGLESLSENGLTQGCFSPLIPDIWGDPYCSDGSESPFPFGCLEPTLTTRAACTSTGYHWIFQARTKAECDGLPRLCYDGANLNGMSQAACDACDNAWGGLFTWKRCIWSPGSMLTLQWTNRTFGPKRKLQQTLDYLKLGHELERAVIASKSLAFSTCAYCSFGAELDAMRAVACSCGSGASSSSCFDRSSSERQVAVSRACPGLSSSITTPFANVSIPPEAFVLKDFCKNVALFFISAAQFKFDLGNKLSSEIFLERPANSFTVVKSIHGATIGQVVTGGIRVSWNFSSPLQVPLSLCIPIERGVPVESSFTELALSLAEGSSISFSAAAWRYNNAICANVTRPGLYVGSLILPDSFDRPSRTIGELAQAIVSSVLYWILTILGLAQLCHILRDHPRSERPKLGYTTLTLAFSVLRGIYFAIPSLVSSSAAAVVVVFEFPSLLFFIMFTTILYLWAYIIRRLKRLAMKSKQMVVWKIYLGVNGAMTLFFILFIIVFFSVPEPVPLPCQVGDITAQTGPRYSMSLAYIFFQAIVVLLLAIAYLGLGIYFLQQVGNSSKRAEILRMTLIVLFVYVSAFLVKCALLLWSALANGVVPMIVFALLEFFPSAVLIYYIYPIWGISRNRRASMSGTTESTPSTASSASSSPSGPTSNNSSATSSASSPPNSDRLAKSKRARSGSQSQVLKAIKDQRRQSMSPGVSKNKTPSRDGSVDSADQ